MSAYSFLKIALTSFIVLIFSLFVDKGDLFLKESGFLNFFLGDFLFFCSIMILSYCFMSLFFSIAYWVFCKDPYMKELAEKSTGFLIWSELKKK